MWPFKRKPAEQLPRAGLRCSYCGSTKTVVAPYRGSDQLDYIRAWRGRRFMTCRCSDCGRDFYAAEPPPGPEELVLEDDLVISDEGALRAAEEEVRRQADEDDHLFR